MNQTTLNKLNTVLDQGYDFRFGDYISRGIDLLKKDIWSFVGFTAVYLLIAVVSSSIPVVGSLAFSLLLSPAFTVGYYLFAHRLDKGERPEFGQFFKGFDYFAPLALVAVVSMGAMLVCMAPLIGVWWRLLMGDLTAMDDFQFSIWMIIGIIPLMYLSVSWMWANMFIVFYDMPFWDAMEMSRKVISKNWLMVFAFIIVLSIIGSLGVIGFCVGLLFTFPLIYTSMYAAFADVTRLMEDAGEMEIEDHLIV
jgi:hypothetical protein